MFFDKRDDSQFDYLTVSETAQDAPADSDDPEAINSPENLSLEASSINQNFSQQILKGSAPHDQAEGQREEFENPNPFFDAEEVKGVVYVMGGWVGEGWGADFFFCMGWW